MFDNRLDKIRVDDEAQLSHHLISEISWSRIENLEEAISIGDMMKVKILEIDERSGKFRLSRRALIERPAHIPEPERRSNFGRDDRRGGRDNRRGGRDDRRPRRDDRKR